jgi:hypothetical protein
MLLLNDTTTIIIICNSDHNSFVDKTPPPQHRICREGAGEACYCNQAQCIRVLGVAFDRLFVQPLSTVNVTVPRMDHLPKEQQAGDMGGS